MVSDRAGSNPAASVLSFFYFFVSWQCQNEGCIGDKKLGFVGEPIGEPIGDPYMISI